MLRETGVLKGAVVSSTVEKTRVILEITLALKGLWYLMQESGQLGCKLANA